MRRQESENDRVFQVAEIVGGILNPSVVVAAILGIFLTVLTLTGGLDTFSEAVKDELPTASLSEPVEVYPFTIAVKRSRVIDSEPGVFVPIAGKKYLILVLEIENISPKTVDAATLDKAITITEVDKKPFTILLHRAIDSLKTINIQPNMKMDYYAVWPVPDTITPNQKLNVTLNRQVWRASSLDGSMNYFDPTPDSKLTLETLGK